LILSRSRCIRLLSCSGASPGRWSSVST
jgi:hypothetical protein